MRINGKRASYYSNARIETMLLYKKTEQDEDLTEQQIHELRKVLFLRKPPKLNLSNAYGKSVCK